MKLRLLASSLLSLMLATPSVANLSGQVLDATTNLPLAATQVTKASTGAFVTTDAQGQFLFDGTGIRLSGKSPELLRVNSLILVGPSRANIEVFDLTGQRVLSGSSSINLARLGQGLYHVRCEKTLASLVMMGQKASLQSPHTLAIASAARTASGAPDTLRFQHAGYIDQSIVIPNSDTSLVIKLSYSAEKALFDSAMAIYTRGTVSLPADGAKMDSAMVIFRSLATGKSYVGSIQRSLYFFWVGRCDFGRDSFALALPWFQNAIDSFPQTTLVPDLALYYQGRCQYDIAKVDSTVFLAMQTTFRKYLNLYPTAAEAGNAGFFMGRSYQHLKQYDSAMSWYSRVERLYPNASMLDAVRFYRGTAQYDLKVYDSCIIIEKTLPAAFPNSLYRDNALYYVGKAWFRTPQLDSAKAALDAVIAWVPTSNVLNWALYYRARVALAANDCAGAGVFIRRLRSEFPTTQPQTLAETYATKARCSVP